MRKGYKGGVVVLPCPYAAFIAFVYMVVSQLNGFVRESESVI